MTLLDITVGQLLTFAGYALPGIILWYFLFRFQNRKALPRDVVRDTFFIGIFSVIPLFFYQYAYQNWLPKISTDYLSTILNSADITTSVLQVVIAFLSMGIFFVLVIGGFTIFYSLFTQDSFKNTLRALISEPLNFGAMSIIFLIVLLIDISLRTFTDLSIDPTLIGTTFILATLEEFSKHLIVRLFDDHKIKNIANAVEFSIIVALSFAFLENIIYFQNDPESFQNLVLGRSIISVLGHIVFSAIFGYYYGVSKFAKPIMKVEEIETRAPALPQWLYKIFSLRTETTYKAKKIFEGVFFASLVHFFFNLSLQFGFMIGVLAILIGGGFLIYLMLNSDLVLREWKLIGSKEMPEQDFEKLSWKISVMKHLQEIKKIHPDEGGTSQKKSQPTENNTEKSDLENIQKQQIEEKLNAKAPSKTNPKKKQG